VVGSARERTRGAGEGEASSTTLLLPLQHAPCVAPPAAAGCARPPRP
jgi:hypothetical protein